MADARPRHWAGMRRMMVDLLERRTGAGVEEWNRRIAGAAPATEHDLRTWLAQNGVTGYAQMLLVMERFGYPEYLLKPSDQLIDEQYADRPNLREIFDAVLAAASPLPDVIVQARKTYVTLVTPRRAFALLKPTTRTRLDLGLRLPDEPPTPRLRDAPRGVGQDAFVRVVALGSLDDVDNEVVELLALAHRRSS